MVAPVPEGSVGFVVVADKQRKEDGGGALEEEAEQGQLQPPAGGAARGRGHGAEAAAPAPALGADRHSRACPAGFTQPDPAHLQRPPPAGLAPAHEETRPAAAPGVGCGVGVGVGGEWRGPEPEAGGGARTGRNGGVGTPDPVSAQLTLALFCSYVLCQLGHSADPVGERKGGGLHP